MASMQRLLDTTNMRSPLGILLVLLIFTLNKCSAYDELTKQNNETEDMKVLVEFLELEYDDECVARGQAEWNLLIGKPNAFEEKLEAEKNFGHVAKTQALEMKDYKDKRVNTEIGRKIQLMVRPGDPILETDKWNKLITFKETAENVLNTATDLNCAGKPCTKSEYLELLATNRDNRALSEAKDSYDRELSDEKKFISEILPLVKEVSKTEGFITVEGYWEDLTEFKEAYVESGPLWTSIETLYDNLQKYVAMQLQKKYGDVIKDGLIPGYLLGSEFGEDWLNIADIVLPNLNLYNKMNENLQSRQIGGKSAFKIASSMLHRLGLKDLKDKFLMESKFDKSCPVKLVNLCRDGVRVYTCNKTSLVQFLDAHEAAMTVKQVELKSSISSNTYIFREANRYSALDEALAGLGSLLAMTPDHLNNAGVLPSKVFNKKREQNKIILQLLTALRDLPRLAYYYAADRWRVEQLDYRIKSIWKDRRQNLTRVTPSDHDYLGDSYILSNRPYLGKFLGILLKYQIFESLTNEMQAEEDIIEHISEAPPMIKQYMQKGFSQSWRDIISPLDIDSNLALLNYYQPLSDFLREELNPETDEKDDRDYDSNNIVKTEDNDDDDNFDTGKEEEPEAPEPEIVTEKSFNEVEDTFIHKEEEDPYVSNQLDNPKEEDGGKQAASSSNLANQDKDKKVEVGSLQYAWIGLGVLVLVIAIILGVVIARKRYKHKKELEKERAKQGGP